MGARVDGRGFGGLKETSTSDCATVRASRTAVRFRVSGELDVGFPPFCPVLPIFRSWAYWMSGLREDVGHLLCDRLPLSAGVCNRVVIPGLLRSRHNKAPITWLEIFGEICNWLSVLDAHLLFANSVQVDVVKHVDEYDSDKKIGVGSLSAIRQVVGSFSQTALRPYRLDKHAKLPSTGSPEIQHFLR